MGSVAKLYKYIACLNLILKKITKTGKTVVTDKRREGDAQLKHTEEPLSPPRTIQSNRLSRAGCYPAKFNKKAPLFIISFL